MKYIWDPDKNAANIAKHGISFERAVTIFEGRVLQQLDDRFDYGETRNQALGLVEGTEIFVVYTEEKDDECRIISARKASRRERDIYWRHVTRSER